jgi:hypothetical protein
MTAADHFEEGPATEPENIRVAAKIATELRTTEVDECYRMAFSLLVEIRNCPV